MVAVLPHYKNGPANKQVATLIFGGQFVCPNTQGYASTDLTITVATSALCPYVIGVAGNDANVLTAQTGTPNTYGQPAIDISVLTDFAAVWYGGVDIPVWYSGQAYEGQLLTIDGGGNGNVGSVTAWTDQGGSYSQSAGDPSLIVARCTQPGGVASAQLTQKIGGLGGAHYFLGRARLMI